MGCVSLLIRHSEQTMNEQTDVSQVYNTFFNTVKELEQFADMRDLRIAFDIDKNAFIMGNSFCEQLKCNLTLWREVKNEIRDIIAKHCPRIHPTGL